MNIKLIASDIDGTILNSNHEISDKTIEVVRKLREQGIHFVLATGRAHDSALEVAKKLQIENEDIGLITLNGMNIQNPHTQEKKTIEGLSFEESLHFKELGEKYHMGIMYCFDNCMYLEMDSRSREDYVNAMGKSLKLYFDFNTELKVIDSIYDIESVYEKERLQKIAYVQSKDYMNLVLDRMKTDTNDGFHLMKVADGWTEVSKDQVNKGAALIEYARQRDIKEDEIMVFGDSENDISMFKIAGISVAMENAYASAKEVATHHTLTNDDDGVALFIEKYLNLK